jgi:hypothetical protein
VFWIPRLTYLYFSFCIGAACIGLGFFTIFQSAVSYLVDTYLMQAASALAANMLLRSVLAGAFPLFANASQFSSYPLYMPLHIFYLVIVTNLIVT